MERTVPSGLDSPAGLQWRRMHALLATLEQSSRSSAVLAAFSFCVFSSLQLNYPSACPGWLVSLLAANSALLVALFSLAFLVSTFLLPRLRASAAEYHVPSSRTATMPPVPHFSPHDRFKGMVAAAYSVSHLLGLFLFLVNLVLITWVKFWDVSMTACIAGSAVMLPFLIALPAFCLFYQRDRRARHRVHPVIRVHTQVTAASG